MPVGFTRSLQIPKPSPPLRLPTHALAGDNTRATVTFYRVELRVRHGRAGGGDKAGEDTTPAGRLDRAEEGPRTQGGRAKGRLLSRTSKEGGGHGRKGRERGRGGGPRASEEGSGRRRRRRDEAWAGGEGGGGNRNGETATGRSLPAGPLSLPRSRTPAAPRPPDARPTHLPDRPCLLPLHL